MLALVDKLDDDKKFLEGKDDLKATLDKIKAQSMRKKAEKLETDAKEIEGLRASTSRAVRRYLDIYNRNPEATDNDEVLYNAGVCFEEGKSIGAAIIDVQHARRSTTRTSR